MSTPTIDERCDAQGYACGYLWGARSVPPALFTADELRRVLTELAMLRETVGVRGDCVSTRNDWDYWIKLQSKADRCDQAERKLAEAIEERDLAIAHDRQPYPTSWAYEQACKTISDRERQRDQWRECAREFYASAFILDPSLRAEKYRNAWTQFEQLSATITGSNERKGSEMPAEETAARHPENTAR